MVAGATDNVVGVVTGPLLLLFWKKSNGYNQLPGGSNFPGEKQFADSEECKVKVSYAGLGRAGSESEV